MNERDLQTVQAAAGLLVDQLRARLCEVLELGGDVIDPVGDVVHSRPALGQEPADRGVLCERAEQLYAALADLDRDRLDSLLLERLAVLELRPEQARVRVEGLLEIADRNPEVVDPPGRHALDATRVRAVPGMHKSERRKCSDFVTR